ncbi:hypothetical protein [Halorussus sp. MSC15.2]|uniref:EMC6-like membrane protein n=1 Tax=Halorussus sp. MSC15.2 TaxID=2283638 RepID=UPI0013D4141A|nr:hypothetical protein [Halorussus sp. MSC15.2]NEU57893.1 hypothetical protein [Halorussus sp. MSC15.2]
MATEQASERRASHIRGVTVTAIASLGGIAAAFVSAMFLGTAAKDQLALGIVGAFVFVQLPILQVLGIDVEDFSTKDHLYVLFMTFSLWFVTWTILLTNGVTF